MAIIDPLPKALAKTLARPPRVGERNVWFMEVASRARYIASAERVRSFLLHYVQQQGWHDRDFTAEIHRAVDRVYHLPDIYRTDHQAKLPPLTPARVTTKRPPWPEYDPQCAALAMTYELCFELKPYPVTTRTVLETLYQPDDLLCMCIAIYDAETVALHQCDCELSTLQYIVANPMTATIGRTQQGKLSPRCHRNATKSRIYQVVEFDQGTLLEQAAILSSLHSDLVPLILVCWSGGKSLHGWFDVRKLPEEEKRIFFGEAVRLGADATLWDPCKLVRMPGGLRLNGNRQYILNFAPQFLHGSTSHH